jgi:hypothetical protein
MRSVMLLIAVVALGISLEGLNAEARADGCGEYCEWYYWDNGDPIGIFCSGGYNLQWWCHRRYGYTYCGGGCAPAAYLRDDGTFLLVRTDCQEVEYAAGLVLERSGRKTQPEAP